MFARQYVHNRKTAATVRLYFQHLVQIFLFPDPDAVVTELVLRTYQEELVQPALEGKNCVIVAPTGSGKTEVAIYAALKHIEERTSQGKPSRVCFFFNFLVKF